MEFYIGQIFEGTYPSEAVDWCNKRGDCFISDVSTDNGVRTFELKSLPTPTEDEIKQREILEIKAKLDAIDLKSIRAIRAEETEYIELYESEAKSLRTKLKELE